MFFNKLLYSIIEALVRVVRGWSLRERGSRLECLGGGVVTAGRRDQGRKQEEEGWRGRWILCRSVSGFFFLCNNKLVL